MVTIYTWITDPAHGWLTVPLAELRELGIAGDISKHSYIDASKGIAYLEEDCDALLFIGAKGIDIRNREASSRYRHLETSNASLKKPRPRYGWGHLVIQLWCDENTRTYHHNSAEGGSAGYVVGRGVYVQSATEARYGSGFHPVRDCEQYSVSAAA